MAVEIYSLSEIFVSSFWCVQFWVNHRSRYVTPFANYGALPATMRMVMVCCAFKNIVFFENYVSKNIGIPKLFLERQITFQMCSGWSVTKKCSNFHRNNCVIIYMQTIFVKMIGFFNKRT